MVFQEVSNVFPKLVRKPNFVCGLLLDLFLILCIAWAWLHWGLLAGSWLQIWQNWLLIKFEPAEVSLPTIYWLLPLNYSTLTISTQHVAPTWENWQQNINLGQNINWQQNIELGQNINVGQKLGYSTFRLIFWDSVFWPLFWKDCWTFYIKT